MSAAPSPIFSCSTRPSARCASSKCLPRAARKRAASCTAWRAWPIRRRPSPPSCTAPRSAPTRCWSAKWRAPASSPRAVSATCWRCAAGTVRTPRACAAVSCRLCRATCAARSTSACWPAARCTHQSIWNRCAPKHVRCSPPVARRGAGGGGVGEGVGAEGTLHTPVDLEQVRTETRSLLAAGCEAVCVFFINTYANPENERLAVTAVRALWPNPHVTSAHEVLPEIREFERCSTAALNAALQPVLGRYLGRLDSDLRAQGFGGELLVVQSNGGLMSRQTAIDLPVRTALSGPAAGVIACASIARAAGFPDAITGDMGGTSFDVSLVADGQAALAPQSAIEFGMVIRSPMIQIETIGAGGGSIASVDASGMLQVGPESVGSVPGPACYGRGGMYATVTGANLLLGRIAAERPLGRGFLAALDAQKSRQAIEEHVARPLALDVHAAAEAILTVANARMAGAIRLRSIERRPRPPPFPHT